MFKLSAAVNALNTVALSDFELHLSPTVSLFLVLLFVSLSIFSIFRILAKLISSKKEINHETR